MAKKLKKTNLALFETATEKLTFNLYTLAVFILTFLGYFIYLRCEDIPTDEAFCFSYLWSIATVMVGIGVISVVMVILYRCLTNENK